MATDIIPNENVVSVPIETSGQLTAVPAELRPCVDHIVTEDNTPVDNVFSEKQQRLLTEPLYSSWNAGRPFVAMANVGLFYAIKQPPFVPDVMLSLDATIPSDPRPKENRSYFVWEYGKPPEVVIEIVSNIEGGEDTEKLVGYARIGVAYYVIFDPLMMNGSDVLRTYRLLGARYERMDNERLFDGVALGLKLWDGEFEGWNQRWLRWFDSQGSVIATGAERADALAQKLREMGVDPNS